MSSIVRGIVKMFLNPRSFISRDCYYRDNTEKIYERYCDQFRFIGWKIIRENGLFIISTICDRKKHPLKSLISRSEELERSNFQKSSSNVSLTTILYKISKMSRIGTLITSNLNYLSHFSIILYYN